MLQCLTARDELGSVHDSSCVASVVCSEHPSMWSQCCCFVLCAERPFVVLVTDLKLGFEPTSWYPHAYPLHCAAAQSRCNQFDADNVNSAGLISGTLQLLMDLIF